MQIHAAVRIVYFVKKSAKSTGNQAVMPKIFFIFAAVSSMLVHINATGDYIKSSRLFNNVLTSEAYRVYD